MLKRKVDWNEFQGLVSKICRDISMSNWRPDYVVGITRGGLLPAVMISQYFSVPCETLKVSLRDMGGEPESNLWMAEDAFGSLENERYIENPVDVAGVLEAASDLLEQGDNYKNILIVDDINDSGATINWILDDWESSCFPGHKKWESDIWNVNVRFATVFDNLASDARIAMDYVGEEINKAEKSVWIEFPFEEWWTK